jgi:hypothetical protein
LYNIGCRVGRGGYGWRERRNCSGGRGEERGTGGVGGVAKPPEMAGILPAAVAWRDRWLHAGRNNTTDGFRMLGSTSAARCFACGKYIAWSSYFMRVAFYNARLYAAFAGARSNPTACSAWLLPHVISHVPNILCGDLFYACGKDFSTQGYATSYTNYFCIVVGDALSSSGLQSQKMQNSKRMQIRNMGLY